MTSNSVIESTSHPFLPAARVLVLVGGLGIAGLGLLGALAGTVAGAMVPTDDRLPFFTFAFSILAIALALGLGLAWHATRSLQARPSQRFAPRRLWVACVLFVLTVALGQALLADPGGLELAFPPFHVLATALPPLILLALVASALATRATWRDLVLQVSSGAVLATSLAFVLQLGLVILLVAAAWLALAPQPGVVESFEAWGTRLQDPSLWSAPGSPPPLDLSPLIVAGILLFAGVAVPIMEEALKTIGVAFMTYRHPTRAEAFLWGVAGGAGFALSESALNSLAGLGAWAPAVVLRAGTTVLHCTAGGLTGLAWHALLERRPRESTGIARRWRVLGLYGAAVGIHGLWNCLAVGISLIALTGPSVGAPAGLGIRITPGIVILVGLLVLQALGISLGLAAVTRHLRPPAESRRPAR